jgi:hypothetical protein
MSQVNAVVGTQVKLLSVDMFCILTIARSSRQVTQ